MWNQLKVNNVDFKQLNLDNSMKDVSIGVIWQIPVQSQQN